jgi:hypothetical protein
VVAGAGSQEFRTAQTPIRPYAQTPAELGTLNSERQTRTANGERRTANGERSPLIDAEFPGPDKKENDQNKEHLARPGIGGETMGMLAKYRY